MQAEATSAVAESGEGALLKRLVRIGIALTSERNMDALLDRILLEARAFTGAEAGSLYLVERDGGLRFCVVQNDVIPVERVRVAPQVSPRGIAGYVARTGRSVMVADAYALPADADFEFNDWFDRQTGYRTRSVLALPMTNPDGRVLGVVQLINARGDGFGPRHGELVLSLASQAAVAVENSRLRLELQEAYRETIFRLARAAEYRDTDTGDHIRRVSQYAAEIARGAGLPERDIEDLLLAVSMHDVGKIAVPDAVLKKPGRLEPAERAEIERHTEFGSSILGGSGVAVLELSREVAHTHHEKWDGSGYPRGLRGEEIPLAGRICALADVFDALTSRRCYKPPMPVEEACEIIRQGAGTHFDPGLTAIFFERLPRLLEIRETHPA